jgi:hypothetical protein
VSIDLIAIKFAIDEYQDYVQEGSARVAYQGGLVGCVKNDARDARWEAMGARNGRMVAA